MCKLEPANNAADTAGEQDSDSSRLAKLEYLSDMTDQLRVLALGMEKRSLAYLLELAMTEAKLQLDAETHSQNVIEEQGI